MCRKHLHSNNNSFRQILCVNSHSEGVISFPYPSASHTVRHPRNGITTPWPSLPLPFYQFLPPSSSRDLTPSAQLSTCALQAHVSFQTFVIPSKLAITWKYVSCLHSVAWLCHKVEGVGGARKTKIEPNPSHPTKEKAKSFPSTLTVHSEHSPNF